jgi:uncharacterized BrkB/YihY/UPF0761 family membrane protein
MLYFISATVSFDFNKQPLALAFVYFFCKIILTCCETNFYVQEPHMKRIRSRFFKS